VGAIVATSQRAPLSVTLSWGLLAAGLVLGASIDGQTTLVTAHYHGTIGAVTVAFMGLTYGLLPSLQLRAPDARRVRIQLNCYAFGNLLMMAGLAGAGWMGAPRKMAGNVGMELSVETLSRMVMGLGGVLAMIGIWMFSWLVLRALTTRKEWNRG
ncbi:MAG TPA: hypothetical protein VJ001_15160, partial [Rhodocyclaceae bacterium]|nr:hypothetical protein [Rhodocyclaceae bacterium]